MNAPAPLVPADVDLRDFGFMPLDVRTLLSSSLWIKAKKDPRVAHAAVSLWCECWHQVPAASLPDDDEVLAELARCDDKEWKRVRDRALLHFVKCSDGRLYHRHVADKALEAWEQRGGFREAKANKESRQQRWRERVKEMAQQLRDKGITPPPGASLETLKRLLDASTAPSTGASTRDAHETGKTGTGTGTGTGTEITPPSPAGLGDGTDEGERAGGDLGQSSGEETAAPSPTLKGQVGLALRRAGVPPTALNLEDPRITALLAAGATPEEFAGIAAEAVAAKVHSPVGWICTTLAGRRQKAAQLVAGMPAAAAPPPPDPMTWRSTTAGVQRMAAQLGMGPPRDAETWPAYETRVVAAWRRQGSPIPQPATTEAA